MELAERLQARVICDYKVAAAFPTAHPLHAGVPGLNISAEAVEVLRAADVVLNLDFIDLAGTLKTAGGNEPIGATIISLSLDRYMHNGWSKDHQGLPRVDIDVVADPDVSVPLILEALGKRSHDVAAFAKNARAAQTSVAIDAPTIGISALADGVNAALDGIESCLLRLSLDWPGAKLHLTHPLDYIGYDGGAGLGSGPGMSVGAALALRGTERLPVAVLGDGDFLMGATALWTAVANSIPLLVIISNNRSNFNDEIHQERMARQRSRPVDNKWIGQRIDNPPLDLCGMARSQGADAIGPVQRPGDLLPALRDAIGGVRAGRVCVVEVRVDPEYDANAVAALMGSPK